MNVNIIDPAQIALRNLSEDSRRKVSTWIDYLKRWESDALVRQRSDKLPETENTYMLRASDDFLIFFTLVNDSITVLDVARKARIFSTNRPVGSE